MYKAPLRLLAVIYTQKVLFIHHFFLRGMTRRDPFDFSLHAFLRVPQTVGDLKAQPKPRPIATELSQPHSHLGGNGHRAGQDTVQGLAADAQRPLEARNSDF